MTHLIPFGRNILTLAYKFMSNKLNKGRVLQRYRAEFSRHVVRILQGNKAEFVTGPSSPKPLEIYLVSF